MLIRLLGYFRSNAIACLALCISLLGLAGGAYAAFTLPPNSVGARQIRNGSIGPVKLDHTLIGGTIRHWAQINALGRVVSSSGGAREMEQPGTGGEYLIAWGHDDFSPQRCTVIATALYSPPPTGTGFGGSVSALTFRGAKATLVSVQTLNAQLQPANEAFSLAVIC